ncbi:contactin-associated protein-like 4 isoform X2 [Carassius carassius]|uniref:contactin-associated protein-like 4 isoform X2 n=1 Tax=Carassius carassius TaxID=217509 RepID=UPI002868CCFE|nr:contactin-associated protein-like 4 isoform X2 [Carassius carassius]
MDLRGSHTIGMILPLYLIFYFITDSVSKESCDSPLVSALPQSAFTSSSELSNSHGPGFAKLNRRDGAGGWSPLDSNKYQWLEIKLEQRTEITAIASQGRYGSSDWVTHYLLMFSDTGHNWRPYRQEDSIGAFSGNSNADSVVMYKLQQPVIAQYVRILPLDWNSNGRIGLRLEAYGCQYKSDVVGFDGSAHLLFRPDPSTTPANRDVLSMNFKTLLNSGMLVHMEERSGHTLTLELFRGKLILQLRKGRGSSADVHPLVSLGSLLDDQHWHHVSVERIRGLMNFTVDKNTQQFQLPESWSHFEINEISFGGTSAAGLQKSHSRRKFQGCLENVLYNDISVMERAEEKQVSITGNVSFTCAESIDVPVTFASPGSFLALPWVTGEESVSVALQFRTWNKAGLLMTFDLKHNVGTLWLYLNEGRARLQIHKTGRIMIDITAGAGLNDGQWHSLELAVRRGRLAVTLDRTDSSTASTSFPVAPDSQLFLGGCPDAEHSSCRNPFSVFQGCMRIIRTDGALVDLIRVQQMLFGNFSDLQMDMCGIVDRCSPNRCEHGGRCSQSWSTFHCNCSATGYSGATCHSSIYEASCEAYKHKGNTSGFYYIDVDGSGPIKPQLIYCNISDKAWMVIQHNNTELTKLKVSSGINQHLAHFNYSADVEQIQAIITQAEYCEQELSYHCKNSRLLNTPDGAPFSWWVGRSGEAHMYWGGAVPGSQQCACGLQENCVHPEHFCNCDADSKEWSNDSGLLSHKEHLPVRALTLGDISRSGSEAAYRVGPLQCYGDNSFWNAAYFNKETSYLHFPTFHGELSADISFLFKTSSSSGVFLENLGIKDFIRIELSSPTLVLFSFDVGNGPLEVKVETASALNDERWHQVRAARNVKEASLYVDHHPGAVQKAPADGHMHLQLNSQLFVGGTASRQKGFLGCIRSLKLNGKTLDLKERAEITPGVTPGCPGHCSSYRELCKNQGSCVEDHSGFTCDCSLSPFTGTFCHKDVSAFFKPGTSVTYTFKEPYELHRNVSAQSSSIYSDLTLRGENVSLSFRTSQAPALLLYISSYYRESLAVLLNRNGHLDVRYKLQHNRDAEVFRASGRNLANGLLHHVSIQRLAETLSIQVDQHAQEYFNLTSDTEFNAIKSIVLGKVSESGEVDPEIARLNALGFTGCLSVVQFNSISPLKAALLYPDTSPVIVTGPLTESSCGSSLPSNPYAAETTHSLTDHVGSVNTGEPIVNAINSDSALIGGVIAVVIFVSLAVLAVMARFLYRRKETFQTQEPKAGKTEDSPETPFNTDPNSQSIISDNQKEYFI